MTLTRLKLLRGGSALYGAEAIGGVVNIITKQPTGSEKTKFILKVRMAMWKGQ